MYSKPVEYKLLVYNIYHCSPNACCISTVPAMVQVLNTKEHQKLMFGPQK